MRVLSFGEILFDTIDGKSMLGGAPLNFALNLSKLGVNTSILSCVGNDELGALALSKMNTIGLETQCVQVNPLHKTGTVEVELTDGQPSYVIHENVAYDFINYQKSAEAIQKRQYDVLYFGTLAQRNVQSRESLSELLKQNSFEHIFYDCNLRTGHYTKEHIVNSLHWCTILKLNDQEILTISEMVYTDELEIEQACVKLSKDFDLNTIVVTAGDVGCYVYSNHTIKLVEGNKITVADTVGAGDAFSAGFVFKYLETGDTIEAARIGNIMGSFVASSFGAIPDFTEDLKRSIGK